MYTYDSGICMAGAHVGVITRERGGVDERIKEKATVVLAAIGLTVSDAFRLLITRMIEGGDYASSRSH